MDRTRPFTIGKQPVKEAWLRVQANKGSGGIDGVSIEKFQEDERHHLYKLWNQMSSGSYFPPAVKLVELKKKGGGIRPLGIPTVADRVAQTVVAMGIEKALDAVFHQDSYGYRPNKSAHQALAQARKRCWQYDWVLDLDIRSFFDTLAHDKLMKAVERHTTSKWVILYIKRWLVAPVQKTNGNIEARTQGVPQGSVIGPLLANLYLHYAMDTWLVRHYPNCPFERFADDSVIHCRTEAEAQDLRTALATRLGVCGLELHPLKTKIAYCKDSNRKGSYHNVQFDFLGYTFKPRQAQNSKRRESFTCFLPAVSNRSMTSMREKMRTWQTLRQSWCEIEDIANEINPAIKGWISYYGKFYKTKLKNFMREINLRLVKWARTKYLKVRPSIQKGLYWLKRISLKQPDLFAHWTFGVKPTDGRIIGAV